MKYFYEILGLLIAAVFLGLMLERANRDSIREGFSPYVTTTPLHVAPTAERLRLTALNNETNLALANIEPTYPRYKRWYMWICNVATRPDYMRFGVLE